MQSLMHARPRNGFFAPRFGVRPDRWCAPCDRYLAASGGQWTDTTMDFSACTEICVACYEQAVHDEQHAPAKPRARSGSWFWAITLGFLLGFVGWIVMAWVGFLVVNVAPLPYDFKGTALVLVFLLSVVASVVSMWRSFGLTAAVSFAVGGLLGTGLLLWAVAVVGRAMVAGGAH
jgi:hypothetical protein